MWLIAGLGNPGPQYECTRHNAGFWLMDKLVRRYGGGFRQEARFSGEVCRITIDSHPTYVLKPMTFMNRSGQAIARLAGFYKFSRPEILIVHDEIDLPTGTIRLKRSGGPGGHNGIRDCIQHLGGNDFLRLRVGVGRPAGGGEVMSYVLRRAPQEEQQLIDEALDDAVKALPLIVAGQLEKAMNTLHSRPTVATAEQQ